MTTIRLRARGLLALLALHAAGCGETLVDDRADPALLDLVCTPGLLACDGRCLACSPPANGHAVCSASACGFDCESGFNRCAEACVAESATACGPGCLDCSGQAPPDAAPTCNAQHACDFECQPGWLRGGGGCQRATAVSAGFEHTCAVTADGRMKCWGSNEFGQLGAGAGAGPASAVPLDVPLPGPAQAISAGYYHTCAVVAGQVYCWGDNTLGELGDGTTTSRPTPTLVPGLSQVVTVTAGGEGDGQPSTGFAHTCAIVAGGALWCWGSNGSGQLGDGTTSLRPSPVPVSILAPGTAVSAVAIGERHTCALAGDAVTCWGANDSGQLGTGGLSPQESPAVPAVPSGASMVIAGEGHSCALVQGTLQCWGLNSSFQVDPSREPAAFPSLLTPSTDGVHPTRAAAGRLHTCAIDGSAPAPTPIRCFGANRAGQLGASDLEARQFDSGLLAPFTAVSVTAGSRHTCVLTGAGGIQCWGANDYGQLGNGVEGIDSPSPTYVSGR